MTEEIAFSDWSKRLEHSDGVGGDSSHHENDPQSATNSWLPAYGFHQPAVLQQAFLQSKNIEFYANDMVDGACANHLLLETIMEETSDDLRSETSESDYNSGLLTDSVSTVIHISSYEKAESKDDRSYWNDWKCGEINTDPGVQDDEDDFTDDDDDEENSNLSDDDDDDSDDDTDVNRADDGLPSRTNSLLQFENLEKHYESIFKTSRTDASDAFENKSARTWPFKSNSQPENLNNFRDIDDDNDSSSLSSSCSSSSSDIISSDELMSSSYSSTKYDSLGRKPGLFSSRSVDSLTSLQQKQEKEQDLLQNAELSQSLNENISTFEEPVAEVPTTPRGVYKTMECLSEIPDRVYRNEVACGGKDDVKEKDPIKERRSAENLSEDSGFGDHITKESSEQKARLGGDADSDTCPDVNASARETDIVDGQNESQGSAVGSEMSAVGEQEREAKFNSCCWQSDPNLLDTTYVIETECRGDVSCDANENLEENATMASRLSVASTPNLYNTTDEEYHYKGSDATDFSECNNESTVSLSRIYSLKRINFNSESQLSRSSSKGSNVQIMTSFVNLTTVNGGSNKGVHFCPVVSEVNWRESYSSESGRSGTESESSDDGSRGRYGTRSEPCINVIKEESYEREASMSPPIDELVEKLLSQSVTSKCGDKERKHQAQRTRLDLIGSPPAQPRFGGGGGGGGDDNIGAHVIHATGSDVNKSSNEANDVETGSHRCAALVNAMSSNANEVIVGGGKEKSKSSVGKLGGFFQRFSLKRLSGRKSKGKKGAAPPVVVGCVPKTTAAGAVNEGSNSRIVPLSDDGRDEPTTTDREVVSSKPPLPPFAPARRRPSGEGADCAPPRASTHSSAAEQQYSQQRGGDSNTPTMLRKTPCIDPNTGIGLLETDIDSNVTLSTANVNSTSSPSYKKSRSLLNLDNGRMSTKQLAPVDRAKTASPHHNCNDYRAKSMEFLLDKENQAAIKAPENELQKGNGERKMSEHELRVQRSLQKLNVPEWYKNSSVPAQGFLLKRHSDAGHNSNPSHHRWNANTLPSKTTSLSSLGSNLSAAPRSPTSSAVTSPGPTHYSFSRWSTSRLNSGTNSSNTSPCGSARSSFNYRQPYLGWRSQEKLSKPRTPAERLAAGLLPQKVQNGSQQSSPSLTEVRSSIKEVTSAIVHYVSGTRDSSDRLSPSLRYYADSSSRSTSPRGSTGRLCWLESSFVGTKPSNVPETPTSATENKIPSIQTDKEGATETYIPYSATNNTQKCCENQTYSNRMNDVASSRSAATNQCPQQYEAKRRRSDSSDLMAPAKGPNRRISFNVPVAVDDSSRRAASATGSATARDGQQTVKLMAQCRYPKCGKLAEPAEAKRTFKVCHNCDYVYCSRDCRRNHWDKHRVVCLQSRVAELCRRVLNALVRDPHQLLQLSRVARRGFLEKGRGCVKLYFNSPHMAEQFINGHVAFPQPEYVRAADLTPAEMDERVYAELTKECKAYDPVAKMVAFVAVHVVGEVPSRGAVKWERQIIYKYAKMNLSDDFNENASTSCAAKDQPSTLILACLPKIQGSEHERHINFVNIQQHLRQRGVNLRLQFPNVYEKLCEYVEGRQGFTPTTIYPVDAATGKTFMCVIMPEAEPEKLDLVLKEHPDVRTVDVSESIPSPDT